MRRRGNAFLWNEKGAGKKGRAIFGKTGGEGLPLGKGTLRPETAHTPKGKKPDGPFP